MFEFFKKNEYTTIERIVTSFFSFFIFGFMGGVVRLFSEPVKINALNEVLLQFLPLVLSFGIVAAILSFFFPKVFHIFFFFLG